MATSRLQGEFEMQALGPLKLRDDVEQIPRLGVPLRTKHPHQALRRRMRHVAELLEADRRVDVIAKKRLAGVEIAPLLEADSQRPRRD